MSKFKITATIPTVEYGNLMPEIEVEAETYEEAEAIALPHIERLWKRYCEPGRELRINTNRKKLEAFVGGQVYYDHVTHTYTNEAGDVYLSGSQYAEQFARPFDSNMIAGKMAEKVGVDPKDIQAMWRLKSGVSTGFGTAIHESIELFGRYKALAVKLGKTTHQHDHPVLKPIVEGFYALQDERHSEFEIVIVDHKEKRAGRIDRLLITGDKKGIIQDIKTNTDVTKSLPVYWKQLTFYKEVMEAGGWKISGLEIYHFNGSWKKYENN